MKKIMITALTLVGVVGVLTLTAVPSGSTVSITGEATCGKCQLKTTKDCETLVTSMEEGRQVTYHLKNNSASKELGKQLCSERKQVKVSGTVQSVDGKLELTPTKVEIVKQ